LLVAQLIAGALRHLEHGARMQDQQRARVGRNDAPTGALQQPLAQLGFQQADLPTERGLCQIQADRRTAEAARIANLDEITQLQKIHGGSMQGGSNRKTA